ncbi:MAG TPA: hypothetical protein VGW12_14275 [Pyrinomonadaceae bacterium]|nr:hypothetical protein [Pyrinomonadaceae bacterium]
MAQRTGTSAGVRKSNRRTTLLWIAAAAAVIIALIWTEQVALLYVLATLSVTALLVIVALSDLGGSRRPVTEPAPHDDSAAAADGLGATVAGRAAAKRR